MSDPKTVTDPTEAPIQNADTKVGESAPAIDKTTASESSEATEPDKQSSGPTPKEDEKQKDASRAENTQSSRKPSAPVSQAVVMSRVSLSSRHAQRVYKRSYSTAARALYVLSVMLRIYASEKEAEQIGTLCDEMLASVRKDLDEEIARMQQVAETQGVDLGAVAYTQPEEYVAEITTPKASQYIGLVRELDRLIGLIDVLWLSGVYNDSQHNAGSYQWQRRLIKLANRLRNLAQRSMALARRDDASVSGLAELLVAEKHEDSEDGIGDENDDEAPE